MWRKTNARRNSFVEVSIQLGNFESQVWSLDFFLRVMGNHKEWENRFRYRYLLRNNKGRDSLKYRACLFNNAIVSLERNFCIVSNFLVNRSLVSIYSFFLFPPPTDCMNLQDLIWNKQTKIVSPANTICMLLLHTLLKPFRVTYLLIGNQLLASTTKRKSLFLSTMSDMTLLSYIHKRMLSSLKKAMEKVLPMLNSSQKFA